MAEPKDWYTAGKLLWTIGHNQVSAKPYELPIKILMHPADMFRLRQRLDPRYWDALSKTLTGVPLEIGSDPTEHVAELVYPGHRWVPVVFDPIDFDEPFPVKLFKDADALRAAGWPR